MAVELPHNLRLINDLETLKVISDSIRFSIFQIISRATQIGETCTVKRLANQLDLPQTKLYYHISLLEKHDFIKVSKTRIVSGIIEKHYQVNAFKLAVSPELFSNADKADSDFHKMVANILNGTLADIQRSINVLPNTDLSLNINIAKNFSKLTQQEFEYFSKRIEELISEFANKKEKAGNKPEQMYGLTCALYPIKNNPDTGEDIPSDA